MLQDMQIFTLALKNIKNVAVIGALDYRYAL
jgi:hypothetical protein